MKYSKSKNAYIASNVRLSIEGKDVSAWSYGWWMFVRRVNGKLLFNNYPYSPTTQRHQAKVKRKLAELGIKVDFEICSHFSLCDENFLMSAVYGLEQGIERLKAEIAKPRSQKAKNEERKAEIRRKQGQLLWIRKNLTLVEAA